MTHKLQVIDYYMDGYQPVSFCKICSTEGDKLFEECPGKYDQGAYDWRNVNGDGFEYAITKGTHGDEFVKLENGEYLRRKIQKHA